MNREEAKDELLKLYHSQIVDLTMMSKIELGDDVIAQIVRLKKIINPEVSHNQPNVLSYDEHPILEDDLKYLFDKYINSDGNVGAYKNLTALLNAHVVYKQAEKLNEQPR